MRRRIMLAVLCLVLIASAIATPVTASAQTVQVLKVNVQGARLRNAPGVSTFQKPSLRKGERVFYWGKHANAFYYVRTEYGRTGYVFKRYLSSYGAANSKQIYYAKSRTPIFTRPSTRSSHGRSLAAKQHVIVYETRGGWAYIKTLSGKGGFVKLSSLRKV